MMGDSEGLCGTGADLWPTLLADIVRQYFDNNFLSIDMSVHVSGVPTLSAENVCRQAMPSFWFGRHCPSPK